MYMFQIRTSIETLVTCVCQYMMERIGNEEVLPCADKIQEITES